MKEAKAMKKFDWVGALGVLIAIGGLVLNLAQGFVDNKRMEAKIDEKVTLALADMTKND